MTALLDETSLIHVCGPPASGKSTLARQPADHLTAKKEPVIFVDKWNKKLLPIQFLASKAARTSDHSVDIHHVNAVQAVFILDDAKCTYRDGPKL